MSYNPDIHHRHSIRLKQYDYSENGMYFMTICVQNRENLFGEIMRLNNAGEMIQKWWRELENKFPNVVLDEYIIMPNHFHGIIQMNVRDTSLSTVVQWFKTMTTNEYIRGVKTDIFPPFDKRIWQRNYYEHIIRDTDELNNIREYIINNPRNWYKDSLFSVSP